MKPTLRIAIEEIYATPPTAMLAALQQPSHIGFLTTLQEAGTISGVFGGLGAAKNLTELLWLGRVPLEGLVLGGPGYKAEMNEHLRALGIIRSDGFAHRVWLDQVALEILEQWHTGVCRAIDRAVEVVPLAARFEYALRWLLQRRLLHVEVEAISCVRPERRNPNSVPTHPPQLHPATPPLLHPSLLPPLG